MILNASVQTAAAMLIGILAMHKTLVAVHASSEVEFSYDLESAVGPEFWKDLVMEDNQCGGSSNSPVALETKPCTSYADYKFTTGTCTYKDYGFVINDHVGQANLPVNGTCEAATLEIPGVQGVFELLQFHVHTSSEHTVNGNHYGAELHMVHKQKDGDRLAVVGVFIEASNYLNNDLFSNVLTGFDTAAGETRVACDLSPLTPWWSEGVAADSRSQNEPVQIYDLIPDKSAFFHYDGGLTTPPCSEIIEWNVADKPLSISVAQFNDLSGLILNYLSPDTCEPASIASPSGSTSRPVQPLNDRVVQLICPVGHVEEEDATAGGTSGAVRAVVGRAFATLATAAAAIAALTM